MNFDEFGTENDRIIVFLHGATFVHTFGRQYGLAKRFHLVVPHIMGYGRESEDVFTTDEAVSRLVDFISSLKKKVVLVGFSLGAQLGYKILMECCTSHQDLIEGAVLVSPWLIKEKSLVKDMVVQNENQFRSMKNPKFCSFIGFLNGMHGKQRKEFVDFIQKVKIETIRNSCDNGIIVTPKFSKVNVPVLALAGGKESKEVLDSVNRLEQLNENVVAEIWRGASHNIPPVHWRKFNKTLIKFVDGLNS